MTALEIVRVLNGLLLLGQNWLPVARRVSRVLRQSIANDNAPIPDADWRWAISEFDEARADLKQAIREAEAEA